MWTFVVLQGSCKNCLRSFSSCEFCIFLKWKLEIVSQPQCIWAHAGSLSFTNQVNLPRAVVIEAGDMGQRKHCTESLLEMQLSVTSGFWGLNCRSERLFLEGVSLIFNQEPLLKCTWIWWSSLDLQLYQYFWRLPSNDVMLSYVIFLYNIVMFSR